MQRLENKQFADNLSWTFHYPSVWNAFSAWERMHYANLQAYSR